MSNINLLDHQKSHVEKIWKTLTNIGELSYIDTSRTGLGKTHVALEIASRLQKQYGMKIGIITCNKQALEGDDGWNFWAKHYGIVLEKATTYSAIRGKGNIISDDWLIKIGDKKKEAYHASEKFQMLANKGIFLIFDEFDMATRESGTHFACAALVRACVRNSNRCRIGLISLTPGNKTEHYPQIMRLAGLIQHTTLVKNKPFTRDYEWEQYGLGEMIRSCTIRGADENVLKAELSRLSVARSKYLIGEMYKEYISKRICFSMPIPPDEYKVTNRNLFLECWKSDLENLNKAIGRLCDGVNWNGYTVAEREKWNLGQINVALKLIERYKLRTIARYVAEESRKNPDKKFVISMGARCTQHFEMFTNILSKYRVTTPIAIKILLDKARKEIGNVFHNIPKDVFQIILNKSYKPEITIMNGETSIQDRVKIMRLFQSESDPSWCLLLSPGVGDRSISLQDTHGNHPRELLVIGDFHHTKMTQLTGRVNRVGLKSDVTVSIVYCKEARLETSILESMISKSVVAKEMLAKDQEHLFPDRYQIVVEKDEDNIITNEIRNNLRL